MKENNLFSLFPNNNNQSKYEKDNNSFLNKILFNSIEEKNKTMINHNNRHYNSSINLSINEDLSPKRNLDNNICYPKKQLMKNKTLNNIDDELDENFNIKIPYNINNKSSNLSKKKNKNLFLNNPYSNLRERIISKPLITHNNINNKDNDIGNFFNPFNLLNKLNQIFRSFSFDKKEKNQIDTKNDTIEKMIINKRYKNTNPNNLENKSNNNNSFIQDNDSNKKRPLSHKNFIIRNYSETFQSEDFNRKQNNFNPKKGENLFLKNSKIENKDSLNKNKVLNKQNNFLYKKDFSYLFNKNHLYIKNIIEKLPKGKNKYIKNIFNYGNKMNYSKLINKDNNFDSVNIFNKFFKKNINNNSFDNEIGNIKIKKEKHLKYLNTVNQNNNRDLNKYIKDSNLNSNICLKDNNRFNKYNYNFEKDYYNIKTKVYKSISIKSAFISVKNKKYSDFIFNLYNGRFKRLFLEFLDTKTILNLSKTSTDFFKMTRIHFYNYFYNRLILDKNKNEYIHKILNNAIKYCSEQIQLNIEKKEINSFYKNLLVKNEVYYDLILKDLTRTMPRDLSFLKGETNYNKLYNILTCYSNYNKKIGYTQGLNYICANAIYLFKSEEEVFVFLDGFINLMELNNYIGIGDEIRIKYKFKELSKILKKYLPEIIEYFKEIGINHEFFTTGWIITLFSSYIERDYLIIIWCFMIIFKWKFVYSFIIQILKKNERAIFNTSESLLGNKMKNIFHHRIFKKDFNEIIQNTLNFMKNNIIF